MMSLLSNLFSRAAPVFSEAAPKDAAAISSLHVRAFKRGWSEDEVDALLIDRTVLCHRATTGRRLDGFIMSRIAADEAEILSVAVSPQRQGVGIATGLLNLHLRRLAGLGVRSVFLEVGEVNDPALRLYRHAGFHEVGKRENYYGEGHRALVLRRDLF